MFPLLGIIFFFFLFVFFIRNILRKKNQSLTTPEIVLALAVKVVAGCVYGYVFLKFYRGDDTWAFHQYSLNEYEKLVNQPGQFFKDLLPITAMEGAKNFWQTVQYYIMDLEYWLILKLLAIFNIFSRGNYYVNVVFFNFISFWGHYWLFSLLTKEFPSKRKIVFITVFLIPPVVFWVSGIRAEGLLLFFLGLVLFHFHFWIKERKAKSVLFIGLAFLGLLIFRSVLLLLLIPALISWFITVRFSAKPIWVFISVYGISLFLFFASSLVFPTQNGPALVVKRQQEFFQLKGNTSYHLDTLRPTAGSFLKVFPQAFANTFLRPYPWEWKGALQLIAAIEIVAFWMLVLFFILKREPEWKKDMTNPLILTFLFFSISLYIFIGYTVPFPGAIVRYKILGELMLIIPFILNVTWKIKSN